MGRHAPPPVGERVSYTKAAAPGVTPDREVKRQKHKLLVVGPNRVAGVAKGEVVELELTDKELACLVEAGHVIPAPKDPRPTGLEQGAGPRESPADKKGN